MLSRTLRRALLDSRYQLPPTFLLPWTASLTTEARTIEASNLPPPASKAKAQRHLATVKAQHANSPMREVASQPPPTANDPAPPSTTPPSDPLVLSPSVRDLLPLLRMQGPHYITAHIQGKAYLLTQGDTVRLPFLMKGVEPGDVLRLDRALNLGSRDFTLKPGAAPRKPQSPVARREPAQPEHVAATSSIGANPAPHFVPNITKGRHSYVDDRLFVCRAVVTGVESEPVRVMEKTKRRQRHVKHVVSKHKYTMLKIRELRVRSLDEIDGDEVD